MPDRCRLCTTNGVDGLVEEVASAMWARHRDSEIMGEWDEAGSYWQTTMRDFARSTVEMLKQGHS